MPTAQRTERPATPADAEAIYALVASRNTAAIGHPDYTLDDARDELVEPGFDLTTDSWLVFDGPTLLGWAWAFRRDDGRQIDVDVITHDPDLAHHLFTRTLTRAAAMATPHPTYTVDIGIYRADTPQRTLATTFGFTPSTTFHRMRADHPTPPTAPAPVEGLALTTNPTDTDFRHTAHTILTESFKDHYGASEKPFEEWQEKLETSTTFTWDQLTVATLHDNPVAVLLQNNQYVEDERCGYVANLGVLPEARGKGIARHLLHHAFTLDHTNGHKGTILHVDTNNTTPALDLYLNAGMHQVLIIDAWRKTV